MTHQARLAARLARGPIAQFLVDSFMITELWRWSGRGALTKTEKGAT